MTRDKFELTIEGRPVPKSRPRVTKKSTRTPKKTKQFEQKVLELFQFKYGRPEFEKYNHFALTVRFYYNGHKTADLDNLCKAVMDGLGGNQDGYRPINDKYISKLDAQKMVDDVEEERTEIVLEVIA